MKDYTKGPENKQNAWFLAFLILAITTNICFFNIDGYNFGRYFAVLFLLIAVLVKVEKGFYLVTFCFPFASVLKFSDESISILPLVYTVLIFKLFVVKKVKFSRGNFVCFVLLSILQLCTILFYEAKVASVLSFLLSVLFVMLSSAYFRTQSPNRKLLETSAAFFSIAVIANIFLCDLFPRIPYIINEERQNALDLNNRFSAMLLDPNELAQVVLIAIFFLVFLLSASRTKKAKLSCLVGIIYLCVNGYRTYSKSYVLALLALFILFVLVYTIRIAKDRGVGSLLARTIPVVLVLTVGVAMLYEKVVIPVLDARADFNTDLLSGRDKIWSGYLAEIFRDIRILLFGSGANNAVFLTRENMVIMGKVTHNTYLEYFIQLGIVGLALLAGCWSKCIKTMRSKLFTYLVLPLLAFLITALGISANANDCIFVLALVLSMPYADSSVLSVKE